ncbi:DUF4440 domain-containing protein [Flagellimonas onchidii]|uniref:DUF4440 domain-containing protein n=1 Tax=Flagellimonas onchidii TaxID=2562684 RepID=UPI0010A5D49A|nr:DUF4440 domain-containing protein [Allomuricauda onchidii]
MKTSYVSQAIFLFTIFLLPFQKTTAQAETSDELFETIKKMDAVLFENGFNQCMISDIEPLISDDLEFYHDQGGITNSKEKFLSTIKQNICSNQKQKPIRKLMENSLEIFPLYDKGRLYGAIQNGTHEFFIKENDKEPYLTSTAKFSHLWIKENDSWKLKRVLSYDHKNPNTTANKKEEITISNAILESYVGKYKGQNVRAIITKKENALQMNSGDMQLIISPESENMFFTNKAPLTFEFVVDNGFVTKMIVRENGNIVEEAKKIE